MFVYNKNRERELQPPSELYQLPYWTFEGIKKEKEKKNGSKTEEKKMKRKSHKLESISYPLFVCVCYVFIYIYIFSFLSSLHTSVLIYIKQTCLHVCVNVFLYLYNIRWIASQKKSCIKLIDSYVCYPKFT
jgi:hypothetical protein